MLSRRLLRPRSLTRLKQASRADGRTGVGHWRTRDGDEVDSVIESDDGTIVGFEVKAGSRVSGEDVGPLRKTTGSDRGELPHRHRALRRDMVIQLR